jgi:hypothetical protein
VDIEVRCCVFLLLLLTFLDFLLLVDEALGPLVVDDHLLLLEHFVELGFVEHALVVEQLEEDVLRVRELFVGRRGRALHVTEDL